MTLLGKGVRALMQSPVGAQLVGIDTERLHPLMFGIGLGLSGVAGCLLSMAYTISPSMGEPYTVTALIVITLGGFGSMGGALAGGLLLGVVEAIGMHFTNPSLKALLSYGVFIAVLLLRPEGLFTEEPQGMTEVAQGMTSKQLLVRDLLVLFGLTGWALALPYFGSEFVVSMALTCLMYVALSSSWGAVLRQHALPVAGHLGLLRHRRLHQRAVAGDSCSWMRVDRAGRRHRRRWWRVVMGAAVLHLRGTYFAVLTFGMTELIRHAVTYFGKSRSPAPSGRVLTVVPERDTIYLTVLALAVLAGGAVDRACGARASAWRWRGIGADEQRAQTLGVNTRWSRSPASR